MKAYLRMYRWAMQMKLHMAMYTFVAIFLKAVTNLLQGMKQMDIMELLSMWGVCLAFAMIESAIFPEGRPCTKGRSALWLVVANLCFIGGAMLFGWFRGVPWWGSVALIAFLELGLAIMWFGDQFVLKMDSAQLTAALKQYQQRGNAE